MRTPVRASAIAITLLLCVAPLALAAWSVKGAAEPDTRHDQAALMQLTPDADPLVHRRVVYFNGFNGAGGVVATTLNPNLALLATSVQPPPFLPVAMFGIWRDCNADGYVGMGDHGLFEYPSTILQNPAICPPDISGSTSWRVHNDGRWVVELIPIGYDDVRSALDEDPLNLNDTQARVWADWGLPGAAPGLACAFTPAPHGTFRSTGGFLRWSDCFSGFRGTRAVTEIAGLAGAPELGFGDAPPDRPDQSGSPLNQRNPWGAEGDAAAVTVFDCGSGTDVVVRDPTDPGGDRGMLSAITDREGRILFHTVHTPNPSIDESGTPAGTVNETESGATDCDRTDADETIDLDGRRAGSDGDLPYALEGGSTPTSPYAPRSRTDFAFTFEEGDRGTGPLAALAGPRARDDAGAGTTSIMGFWVATSPALGGRNAYVARQEIAPEAVSYVTYYAYVAPALVDTVPLHMPNGRATLFYGAEGCNTVPQTYLCDATLWWRNSAGEDVTPRDARLGVDPANPTVPSPNDATRIGVRVWQRYHMRDIDCVDTSAARARETGLHWGALTGTACQRT